MIIHNLSEEELLDLVSMMKKDVSSWRWVNGKDGTRIRGCSLSIKAGQITEAKARTAHTEAEIVDGIYAALCRRRKRRSDAAKKAAVTRAKRKAAKAYEIAERIVAGKNCGPSYTCAACSKPLTDSVSIRRGIGSDCWQGIMELATRMGEKKDDSHNEEVAV
jgi:hypothetical protein